VKKARAAVFFSSWKAHGAGGLGRKPPPTEKNRWHPNDEVT